MSRTVLLLIAFAAMPVSTLAENWPQFRGPTGQGHSEETGLPVEWGPRKNVAWKTEIPGLGWSSPIYWDGKIFLTTATRPQKGNNPRDRWLRTVCLDAKTGRIVWNRKVFAQQGKKTRPIHNKNSHASPTPVTDGEFVYVHFGPHGTACLRTDGEVVWKNRQLKYNPRHGNGGSPVLAGDGLVVSCDGVDVQAVVALDRKTGEIRWQTRRPELKRQPKFSFGTPLMIDVGGQRQLVSPGTNCVVAYDPAEGRELWQVDYTGYSVVPRPVYAHGLVFLATGFNSPTLLSIDPTGTGNVTDTHVKWTADRAVPLTPSMLVVGDELYFVSDDGIARCVNAKTGENHWMERLGGNYSASPVHADGKIYFQSEEGVGTVIRPGTEYEQLAVNNLEERTLASYAVAESALFIRSADRLYRIEKPSPNGTSPN